MGAELKHHLTTGTARPGNRSSTHKLTRRSESSCHNDSHGKASHAAGFWESLGQSLLGRSSALVRNHRTFSTLSLLSLLLPFSGSRESVCGSVTGSNVSCSAAHCSGCTVNGHRLCGEVQPRSVWTMTRTATHQPTARASALRHD